MALNAGWLDLGLDGEWVGKADSLLSLVLVLAGLWLNEQSISFRSVFVKLAEVNVCIAVEG